MTRTRSPSPVAPLSRNMSSFNMPSTSTNVGTIRGPSSLSQLSYNLPSTSMSQRTASPETMRQLSMMGMQPSTSTATRPSLTRSSRVRLTNPQDVRTFVEQPEMRATLTRVEPSPVRPLTSNQIMNISKIKSVNRPSLARME